MCIFEFVQKQTWEMHKVVLMWLSRQGLSCRGSIFGTSRHSRVVVSSFIWPLLLHWPFYPDCPMIYAATFFFFKSRWSGRLELESPVDRNAVNQQWKQIHFKRESENNSWDSVTTYDTWTNHSVSLTQLTVENDMKRGMGEAMGDIMWEKS